MQTETVAEQVFEERAMAQSKRGTVRRMQQRGNWTEDSMREAIKEVKKGTASIGKIGEKYGIPESSIRDWLTGKTSSKKKGPRTVLTKEEEDAMVDWCLDMQRNGHAITFYMLRRKVADVCQGRETPFRNGVPGKSWMDWFRKRHPSVLIEAAHALKGKKRNDSQGAILGSEPSGMETHDTRDIVLQLIQQDQHIDSQLPAQPLQQLTPTRQMDGVNEENTPAYEPWKGQEHTGQERTGQERSEAGGASSDSDGSEGYPSSGSIGGSRWIEIVEGMAGIERAIRESEDRKDRRLERQLEANDRIAAGLIGALGQVSECLRGLGARGLGPGDLGAAVAGLGGLAGLGGGLGGQQP